MMDRLMINEGWMDERGLGFVVVIAVGALLLAPLKLKAFPCGCRWERAISCGIHPTTFTKTLPSSVQYPHHSLGLTARDGMVYEKGNMWH